MQVLRRFSSLCVLAAAGACILAAQFADRKAITLDGARKVVAAAQAEARKNNWNVVIAIVDEGGRLICFERMDDAQLASIDIAQDKARSAVLYRRPTKMFDEQLAGGRQNILKLPGAMPAEGGLPISAGGRVIGAIGVSGATSAQDAQVARAGLAVLPGYDAAGSTSPALK